MDVFARVFWNVVRSLARACLIAPAIGFIWALLAINAPTVFRELMPFSEAFGIAFALDWIVYVMVDGHVREQKPENRF